MTNNTCSSAVNETLKKTSHLLGINQFGINHAPQGSPFAFQGVALTSSTRKETRWPTTPISIPSRMHSIDPHGAYSCRPIALVTQILSDHSSPMRRPKSGPGPTPVRLFGRWQAQNSRSCIAASARRTKLGEDRITDRQPCPSLPKLDSAVRTSSALAAPAHFPGRLRQFTPSAVASSLPRSADALPLSGLCRPPHQSQFDALSRRMARSVNETAYAR